MGPQVSESSEREFRRLYERFYSEVRAFCARRVGRADAEDVAAEVFVTAWRRFEEIDAGSERAWLFASARNLILNQWRSASRRTRLVGRIRQMRPPEPEQPETVLVDAVGGGVVFEALQSLRESDKEILILSAWDGLSGPEISHVLNVSRNTAHQRLHRAKRRLATAIERHGDPETVELIAERGLA